MMTPTRSEERYLKALYKLTEKDNRAVSTGKLAQLLEVSAPAVTDMLKKLTDCEWVIYRKNKGVSLTTEGKKYAVQLVRKQRLWRCFLVYKLRYPWYQVEKLSDDMMHLDEKDLVERLDAYLDYPKFDPFGESIPNKEGKFTVRSQSTVSGMMKGQTGVILGVREFDDALLLHLSDIHIRPGSDIRILSVTPYDMSMQVAIDNKHQVVISKDIAQKLLVKIK